MLLLPVLLLFLPLAAAAQESQPTYAISRNVSADDRVLELDVPPELDGDRFLVVFRNASGPQRIFRVIGRAGTHSYEVRYFPEWSGRIAIVATTERNVQGRVKIPTLSDGIDMFLEPDRITPSTINMLIPRTIFSWSWTTILLFTFFIAASLFFLSKKKAHVSVMLGFVVAWTLMDLRTAFDHATIIYKKEKYHQGLPPLTAIKDFSDEAAQKVDRSAWDHRRIDPLSRSFLRYRLAENPYAATSDRFPTFSVTQNPADGEVVFQHEKFFLVRKNKS